MTHNVGFVPLSQVKQHLRLVKARTKEVFGDGGRAKQIGENADLVGLLVTKELANEKLNAVVNAPSYDIALGIARELLDLFSAAAHGKSACKAGCSACCYIPVAIPSSEAKIIARDIGKSLSKPPTNRTLSIQNLVSTKGAKEQSESRNNRAHNGTPCPFLKAGECSIYANRPIACRQQINMDIDALLCKLVKGHSVLVPYLNLQNVERALALFVHRNIETHWDETIADIRDWFQ